MAESRIRVAVLGATGLVGQRLVTLLDGHPWFRLTELGASERSAGLEYGRAVRWALPGLPPPEVAALEVRPCAPESISAPLVFSALDAAVAGEVEASFAATGRHVVSNARNHRMEPSTPLVVPEINPDHLELLEGQAGRQPGGGIVANPNCTTVGLALALAPLQAGPGIRRVSVVSMQALSGAGLPGPPALSVLGNVLPHIPGEEEKVAAETLKILGRLEAGKVVPASFAISAACHRVPVRDGHLLAVSVETERPISPSEAAELMAAYSGSPRARSLPSAPERPLVLREDRDRPQPAQDRDEGRGMSVVVGPVERCAVLGLKFRALVHNTIRGAAGATLLNAELLRASGRLEPPE